jgi:hypothetical protein
MGPTAVHPLGGGDTASGMATGRLKIRRWRLALTGQTTTRRCFLGPYNRKWAKYLEPRSTAQAAVNAAELAAAAGIDRLIAEKLTVADIANLTGLDQATLRRLRHLTPRPTTHVSPA